MERRGEERWVTLCCIWADYVREYFTDDDSPWRGERGYGRRGGEPRGAHEPKGKMTVGREDEDLRVQA